MKKQTGFTLSEILIMVFILSIAMGSFIKWQIYRNTLLATRTYVDQTKVYSNVFIGYLKSNLNNISAIVNPSNPIAISWSDLASQGYVPTGLTGKNSYNQSPCLIVTQNNGSNLLYPILVFVDGQNTESGITTRAMALMGGYSGIYMRNNDTVTGDFGLWSYPSFAGAYRGLINHCGGRIADNSIVMNIGMINDFNDAITPDVSVHRYKDQINPNLGESFNANTAYTDITLTTNGSTSSNKLYFNHTQSVYFSQSNNSNPTVTLNNGSLVAQALLPTTKKTPGQICDPSQVGSVSSQVDASYGMQASVLVCSYNPPVCQAQAGSDYCFTPIKHNTIKFTNTGNMSSSFLCPAGAPVVSDASANTLYLNIQYRECRGWWFTYDCSQGNIQNVQQSAGSSGQPITTPINVDGVNYYMQVGYKAINPIPALNSCSSKCSALGMSEHNNNNWPRIFNATCACDSGTPGQSNYRAIDVMSVTPIGTPTINYVTCTSKMVLTQQ